MRSFVSLALVLVLVGCDDHVSAPDPATDFVRASCRLYPTQVRENGSELTCTVRTGGAVILECRSGPVGRTWEYASLEDFVGEIAVPNKYLRTSAGTSFSSMLNSSSSTRVAYEYDDQGRLARRVRTGFNVIGAFTHDTTTFTAWDSRGRPLAASIVRPTGDERLASIAYDDAAREVVWSDGERNKMDRHGNTLLETWVFNGAPFTRAYEILALAEVCLP